MPLIAAAVGLLAWQILPGTSPDRAAFEWVARCFANPPFFISGFGSRQTPWNLLTFSSTAAADKRHAPLIVSLGDDPQGVFQSSPPSPVDLAVVFNNFQRLGAKKAASAAVLAWDSPDVMGLAALEKTLAKFDSMVMAAPVSRGASPQPLPETFRRTSIPASAVKGDVSMIPVVNRIPLPDVILGGRNSAAGFSSIDSEAETVGPFLLARWEDRIVFSFPMVVMMQRLEVAVDAVEVVPGEYLRFGSKGPIVPIDASGRMKAPVARVKPIATIPAEELIDGGDDLFPKQAPDPVILRDDRGAAEPGTRIFSGRLAGVIASISSNSGLASAEDYPRPGWFRELLLLAVVCGAVAGVSRLPRFAMWIGYAATATAVVTVQILAAGMASCWVPGLAGLMALVAGMLASIPRRSMPKDQTTADPEESPPTAVEIEVSAEVSTPDVPPEPEPEPTKKPRSPRRKAESTAEAQEEKPAPKPRKPRATKKQAEPDASGPEIPEPVKKPAQPRKSRAKSADPATQAGEKKSVTKKATPRTRRKPEA